MDIISFIKTLNRDCLETKLKWGFIDKYFSGYQRSKLKNKNFSVICNNCVAGGIYHKLGLPYTSPTVGLFFFSEDYIRFLEGFQHYVKQPLSFKTSSVHDSANELRKNTRAYPIGTLDDIEVHFLHYQSEQEATEKWHRRVGRINFDNLFFLYSDGGGGAAGAGGYDFSEEYLERYDRLPFEHKLFFSSKPRVGRSVVFIREYAREGFVGNSICNRKYERYINLIKWLNGENDFLKK